jgi:lysophospholipase L1-like esterase
MGLLLITLVLLALTGVIEELEGHGKGSFRSNKKHAVINDWSSIQSSYELKLGNIDHWCLDGTDENCPSCEDPLHPIPRLENKDWMKAYMQNVRDGRKYYATHGSAIDVLFVGDGNVEARAGRKMGTKEDKLITIKDNFDTLFDKNKGGKLNGMAFGIEGDTSPTVLWRISESEVIKELNPAIWWLSFGIHDLVTTECSEDITLMGILRVVEELKAKRPNASIVINSLLPYSPTLHAKLGGKFSKNTYWPSIQQLNQNLKKFASKHNGVYFFNADDHLVEERYSSTYPVKGVFEDDFHLSFSGQKLLMMEQVNYAVQILDKKKNDESNVSSQSQDDNYYDDDAYAGDDDGSYGYGDDFF